MNYQIILTVWLIIQFCVCLYNEVEFNKLKYKGNITILKARLIGSTLKYIGIFSCLYFGGFYL